MANLHIKKGDTVVVLSGDDKGVQGEVIATSPEEGKVIVKGVNIIHKHVKPRREGETGGIVDAEGAIYASNVRRETKMARLKDLYKAEVAPALLKKYNYKSVMQIPKLDKIVINVGVGDAKDNSKALDAVLRDLSIISGQKAIATRAKKSVANFKVREGMKIGAKVTLRGDRMYEFMDRLFNFALPKVRDFKGINPNAFDGRGNYALGLKEQLIFPEIEYDKVEKIRGMDICFVTTAQTDDEAREMLTLFGAPFAK